MEKRWHKINDVVEAQILTKSEVITLALFGILPVCTVDGSLLIPIQIDIKGDGKGINFLCEWIADEDGTLAHTKLYRSYDDIKDFIIKECHINECTQFDRYFWIPIKQYDDIELIEIAKKKICTDNIDESFLKSDCNMLQASILGKFYPEENYNSRSGKKFIKTIIGLAKLGHINLAEPGLADSLEQATEEEGCKLPRSTAYTVLNEVREYQRNIQE